MFGKKLKREFPDSSGTGNVGSVEIDLVAYFHPGDFGAPFEKLVQRMNGNGQPAGLVMHGNHQSGTDIPDDLPALLWFQGENPPHRNKKNINFAQLFDDLLIQGMPQVPQVAEGEIGYIETVDDITAPLLPFHLIMEGGEAFYFQVADLVGTLSFHDLRFLF